MSTIPFATIWFHFVISVLHPGIATGRVDLGTLCRSELFVCVVFVVLLKERHWGDP